MERRESTVITVGTLLSSPIYKRERYGVGMMCPDCNLPTEILPKKISARTFVQSKSARLPTVLLVRLVTPGSVVNQIMAGFAQLFAIRNEYTIKHKITKRKNAQPCKEVIDCRAIIYHYNACLSCFFFFFSACLLALAVFGAVLNAPRVQRDSTP